MCVQSLVIEKLPHQDTPPMWQRGVDIDHIMLGLVVGWRHYFVLLKAAEGYLVAQCRPDCQSV
eukprot:scaffold4825_cov38-Tisochrysis_lutea.AAC.1